MDTKGYKSAFAIVTILFFMSGFLTCLNDILVPHLKPVFDLNYTKVMLIQFTFFAAYFLMSIPAGKLIARFGYQRGVVVGLGVAGVGAMIFYPAAGMLSYPLFLTALFVLATGITVLQVAANPYASALGKPETASSRLNLAQAVNSLGHTTAPFIGGLLEHTLNVVRCCDALAGLYPDVDRDMLLTGAALHDIGKTEELLWPGAIMYSDSGNLVGHVVGGTMMVKDAAEKTEEMDPLMSLALQHMILAHHGVAEYGSPKCPMSIEALILHYADDIDARMAMFKAAIEESGGDRLFTKKHHLLDRRLFRGLKASEEAADLELLADQDASDPFTDE